MRPVSPSSALRGTTTLLRVYIAIPEYPLLRMGKEKKESKEGGRATCFGSPWREDFTSGNTPTLLGLILRTKKATNLGNIIYLPPNGSEYRQRSSRCSICSKPLSHRGSPVNLDNLRVVLWECTYAILQTNGQYDINLFKIWKLTIFQVRTRMAHSWSVKRV